MVAQIIPPQEHKISILKGNMFLPGLCNRPEIGQPQPKSWGIQLLWGGGGLAGVSTPTGV